ncbi:MAG TPA: SRPBCC family protein [bacterium]|jgi:hypothetical protein|nr:SRPBCC family protein [bacterium]
MTLRLPCLLLMALACAARAPLGSGVPDQAGVPAATQVTLSLASDDLYAIHGFFTTTATPAAVWRVLSDYQGLAGIVRGLKSSRVLRRDGGRLLVEQVMEGHFLFFEKTLDLRLWITERPPLLIEFSNADRAPFRTYQGAWRISPTPGGCGVDYTLRVSRGDLAPRFMEQGLFTGNSEALLRDLSGEIARRAADVPTKKTGSARPGGPIPPGGNSEKGHP